MANLHTLVGALLRSGVCSPPRALAGRMPGSAGSSEEGRGAGGAWGGSRSSSRPRAEAVGGDADPEDLPQEPPLSWSCSSPPQSQRGRLPRGRAATWFLWPLNDSLRGSDVCLWTVVLLQQMGPSLREVSTWHPLLHPEPALSTCWGEAWSLEKLPL